MAELPEELFRWLGLFVGLVVAAQTSVAGEREPGRVARKAR